jgi:CheY-like chemotaxis protein
MAKELARILLGEDNVADVYLIKQALTETAIKYELHVARHGEEMLALLQKAAEEGAAPDLIVLDLNLPRHDGLEILKFIRQNRELSNTPVVILTSSDSPKDVGAASQLGADRYIRKPSQLDAFMAIGQVFRDLIDEGRRPLVEM